MNIGYMNVFRLFFGWSKKKNIVFIGGTVVTVLIIMSIIGSLDAKPKYTMASVMRKDITEVVTETGIVQTTGITNIYTPATGIITAVLVANGDRVNKGDTLFTVQSTATEKEKADALTNFLSAKSLLDAAETNMYSLQATMFSSWEEFRDLAQNDTYETSEGKPREENRTLPEFLISQREWLASEKSYKDQQTTVSQAKAAVAAANEVLAATRNATIKAPVAGVVANIAITQGGSVTASLSKPVALIVTQGPSEVVVSLGESDISKIRVGQEVTVEVKAIYGLSLAGKVARVDSVGSDVKGVIRYTAYIVLENPDSRLRSGMKTDVTVTTQEKQQVLVVPNSSVKPYKGSKAVRILGKGQKVEYLPVTIGIKGDTHTEILSGLSEGQAIILSLPNDQIKRTGLLGF